MTTNYECPTLEDELILEAHAREEAIKFTKKVIERTCAEGQVHNNKLGKGMISYGFDALVGAVNKFVEKELAPKCGVVANYHPIIVRLKDIYKDNSEVVNLLSLCTVSVCINVIFTEMKELNAAVHRIAQTIEDEAHLQAYITSKPDNLAEFKEGFKHRCGEHYKHYYAMNKAMKEANFHWTPFDDEAGRALSGKLVEMLIKTTGLFTTETTKGGTKINTLTTISPTQLFIDTWNKNETILLGNTYRSVPMIIKPKPWTAYNEGGYYGVLSPFYSLLRIMRVKSTFYYNYMHKLEQTDLSKVTRAINAVQETPWTINRKVLAVVEEIIEMGGDIGGIPRKQPLPELPNLVGDYTPKELKEHKKKKMNRIKAENRRKAKMTRCVAMLQIAKQYAPYHAIYFPCNMDFRGRVYPIPTFSFQGDDFTKGLLLMQDTPPCTDEKAEYWFRIAGCEFFGNDKVSFDDQIKWTHDNEEAILSVAADPLGEARDFWANSDCPIEFLGWCFEYEEILKYKKTHNNSVIGWTCGIPVAFDGTCSGLQHFSAALRDEIGGSAVNLLPGDKPRDIYGIVAEKVNVQLKKDAMNGTPDEATKNKKGEPITKYGTKSLAQMWLAYGVNRKVTKRCVMTLAYGSKQYGFKGQIIEDTLEPAIEEGRGDMFVASKPALATYLAKLIWQSVTVTVVKAVEGMKWLQEVASLVCQNDNAVTWHTPMGLPVQQNYMERNIKTFRMRFMGTIKRFYIPELTGAVAGRKQAQGIAPNFIHSMDASHLQWSINRCLDKGIKHYSMIHDSYATCPAQADTLFHTVREAFVEMYTTNDVLMNFKEDMQGLVAPDVKIPDPPVKGTLDIKCVLESLYMFH